MLFWESIGSRSIMSYLTVVLLWPDDHRLVDGVSEQNLEPSPTAIPRQEKKVDPRHRHNRLIQKEIKQDK